MKPKLLLLLASIALLATGLIGQLLAVHGQCLFLQQLRGNA